MSNAAPMETLDISQYTGYTPPVDYLETIIQLTTLINSSLADANTRENAVKAASNLVDCEASSLLLVNEETGGLYFDIALGEHTETLKSLKLLKGQGIAGWVVEQNKAIIIDNTKEDARFHNAFDSHSGFQTRNMLCVPVTTASSKTLGVLQAINKQYGTFTASDKRLLTAISHQIAIAIENTRLHRALDESHLAVVRALADVLEKRDPWAAGHAKRVTKLCITIGKMLGLNQASLEQLRLGAILHDIGMIGIPDDLLMKKTEHHADARDKILDHTDIGEQIIGDIKQLAHIVPIIKYHHEHIDGSGPYRLDITQIPLQARILSVADAFDGMTSRRPYFQAIGPKAALDEIKQKSGTQFDTRVVQALLKCPIRMKMH